MQHIKELYCSRDFKLLSPKMKNFAFFARRKITDACLFVFFPGGDRIDPVVLECRELEVLVAFLSDQKLEGN